MSETVVGVVNPFAGTSTARSGGPGVPWTARVDLICVQRAGGEVSTSPLTLVSRELPDAEASALIEGLGGYDVVRCEVDGETLLSRPEPAEPTPELADALALLRRPVVVAHELGVFTYTLESAAFDGAVKLDGAVAVSVATDSPDTARRLLDALGAAMAAGRLTAERLVDRAVAEMLDLANDEWLDEPEPLTASDFRRRLRFTELALDAEGGFEAYSDDDGIFAGHTVLVQGSLTDGATDATIAG